MQNNIKNTESYKKELITDEDIDKKISDYDSQITENDLFDKYSNMTDEELEELSYREEQEKDRSKRFIAIEEDWLSLFRKTTWNNDTYLRLLLHIALGQQLKNLYIRKRGVEIDGRISLILIQDQGTGKGTPLKQFRNIVKQLYRFKRKNQDNKEKDEKVLNFDNFDIEYLKPRTISDFSDSGMIGTRQEIIIKGKREEREVIGVLDERASDFIIIPEASVLFNDKKNSNIIQYLNLAQESKWNETVISKYLNAGEINCHSEASFIYTTYPTLNFSEEFLNSGFFRRNLVFYNKISWKQKKDNLIYAIQGFGNVEKNIKEDIFESLNTAEVLASVINMTYFRSIKGLEVNFNDENTSHKIKNPDKIYMDIKKDAQWEVDRYAKAISDKIALYSKEVSSNFQSVLDTYINYAMTIAGHRAFYSGEDYIDSFDAKYGLKIIDECLESYINFLKDTLHKKMLPSIKAEGEQEINFKQIIALFFKNKEEINKKVLLDNVKIVSDFSNSIFKDLNKLDKDIRDKIEIFKDYKFHFSSLKTIYRYYNMVLKQGQIKEIEKDNEKIVRFLTDFKT